MNNNLTELVYILDKSGSMYGLTSDTIGGYNAMIAEQKTKPGNAKVTTVLFNDKYTAIVENEDIQNVPEMTNKEYFPTGTTAMLDAVGNTIRAVGEKLNAMPESERPGSVIVTIVTDGMENASKEYTYQQIKDMIEEQRNKYSWVFVFIGANIDAESVGVSMGIDRRLSKQYTANSIGTETLYKSVSNATSAARGMSCRGVPCSLDSLSDILDEIQ